MNVVYDGDEEEPQVQLRATAQAWRALGRQLMALTEALVVAGDGQRDEHFPGLLKGLRFVRTDDPDSGDLIRVSLRDGFVCFEGGAVGLGNLGESCLNFFADPIEPNEHFHLDYFEGDQLLAPTSVHLILMCA